jgi:GNAT superfamily N-acetyltransferase
VLPIHRSQRFGSEQRRFFSAIRQASRTCAALPRFYLGKQLTKVRFRFTPNYVIGKDMGKITIQRETRLDADEFLSVLRRSGLGERRPVEDAERISAMAANANLIITARDDGLLIGVSRCGTDFAYFCYCSDLAVDRNYQGQGIGQRLLDATKAALHPDATLYLISAPKAVSFYEHIGMTHHDRCFALLPEQRIAVVQGADKETG